MPFLFRMFHLDQFPLLDQAGNGSCHEFLFPPEEFIYIPFLRRTHGLEIKLDEFRPCFAFTDPARLFWKIRIMARHNFINKGILPRARLRHADR